MIGEALKMFRTIHGHKAKELAELLEISPSYLSEIETGKKKPSYELLEKYSEVFDIKLSALIVFSEDYHENKSTDKAKNGVRKMLFNFMKRLDEETKNENEDE